MRRVAITGGPGVGKTTLLAELHARGYSTVAESARQIISERLSTGDTPRPEPQAFARELLRRDLLNYESAGATQGTVFFDRCLIESVGMVREVAAIEEQETQRLLLAHAFHRIVFLLPPWAAIYRTDKERDHSFAHCKRVHGQLLKWYRQCGYEVHEVPRLRVDQRVEHVLQTLALSDA